MSACVGGVMRCVHDRKSLNGSSSALYCDLMLATSHLILSSHQQHDCKYAAGTSQPQTLCSCMFICSCFEVPHDQTNDLCSHACVLHGDSIMEDRFCALSDICFCPSRSFMEDAQEMIISAVKDMCFGHDDSHGTSTPCCA